MQKLLKMKKLFSIGMITMLLIQSFSPFNFVVFANEGWLTEDVVEESVNVSEASESLSTNDNTEETSSSPEKQSENNTDASAGEASEGEKEQETEEIIQKNESDQQEEASQAILSHDSTGENISATPEQHSASQSPEVSVSQDESQIETWKNNTDWEEMAESPTEEELSSLSENPSLMENLFLKLPVIPVMIGGGGDSYAR